MGWDEINPVIIQLLSRVINSVCSGTLIRPSQLALFDNIVTSVRQHFVIDRAHSSDPGLTVLAIVDMFMLRLDELTIALHKHYSSNSETSSDSTARPAHRHKAVAASTSPAYRHIGDSIVTAQREPPAHHQHIATPGDSIVTATAASTSPAHRHTQRQHSDSTVTAQQQWQNFQSIQRMN